MCISIKSFFNRANDVSLFLIPTPPSFLGTSSPNFHRTFRVPGRVSSGGPFFGHFWQNWINGGYKDFPGGDMPSISEESLPGHVDADKTYQIFQSQEKCLKNAKIG